MKINMKKMLSRYVGQWKYTPQDDDMLMQRAIK